MGRLRFKNKKFKIMLVSDIQDKVPMDKRTLKCMEKLIEVEKPDLVFLNGDNCTGEVPSKTYFETYVSELSRPMESKGIYWAHVFGNHDDESIASEELGKAFQQGVYERMPHCLSERGPEELPGIGNYVLPIYDSQGEQRLFHIWALDAHTDLKRAHPGKQLLSQYEILNNGLAGHTRFDFIKFKQVEWYYNQSEEIERQLGRKVPGLMFFHTALPEHQLVLRNPEQTDMRGEANEEICNSPINSGLFAATLERGDIKGIFVGHDHINDLIGNVYGIMMGFDASIGYHHYGLWGESQQEQHRLRGARFFEIDEEHLENIKTYMRYGAEFEIW